MTLVTPRRSAVTPWRSAVTSWRSALALAAICAGAIVLGVVIATAPALAVAAVVGALIFLLPFRAPVAHMTLLLFVAALVPYDLQNRFGLSLGGGATGLVLVDALVLAGLFWAMVTLPRHPLDRRTAVVVTLIVATILLALVQLVHGMRAGHELGDAGLELRGLLGLGALLMALPLLHQEGSRRRLYLGLMIVGLLLGLWGNAQWVLQLPSNISDEVGVREGVALTTSGVGQVLGGRYAFPAAIILAFAALISGQPRSRAATTVLATILVLNTVALVLTFERAFWLATAFAVMLVVVRAGYVQRARALAWGGMGVLLCASAFTAIAPGQSTTVTERLLSIGQYKSDLSVNYRVIESRHVAERIRRAELSGSGLGASIYWGRPAQGVPPSTETYSHNAYLWLAWKLGIPGALLVVVLIAAALARRREPRTSPQGVLRSGAQATLLAMLLMGVTAPVFSTLSASALIGILMALAAAHAAGGEPGRAPAATPRGPVAKFA
ncbi:MAG: O-antigen ligase family protein [Actinomycetota bacterium]|nr:O-antigen ligase family protein [Actinomycetota bacterium]